MFTSAFHSRTETTNWCSESGDWFYGIIDELDLKASLIPQKSQHSIIHDPQIWYANIQPGLKKKKRKLWVCEFNDPDAGCVCMCWPH